MSSRCRKNSGLRMDKKLEGMFFFSPEGAETQGVFVFSVARVWSPCVGEGKVDDTIQGLSNTGPSRKSGNPLVETDDLGFIVTGRVMMGFGSSWSSSWSSSCRAYLTRFSGRSESDESPIPSGSRRSKLNCWARRSESRLCRHRYRCRLF